MDTNSNTLIAISILAGIVIGWIVGISRLCAFILFFLLVAICLIDSAKMGRWIRHRKFAASFNDSFKTA
jgi:hypothetical protein